MAKKLELSSRIAHAFRQTASVLATALGMLLLVADSTDDCEVYKSFRDEFNFVSTCTPSGIAGSTSVAGTAGFGATAGFAGTSGSGGGAGSAATAGTAGSTEVISGHVSLSIPKLDNQDDAESRADGYAEEDFRNAGLDASADVHYSGDCSGGEGTGKVSSVTLSFGDQYSPVTCSSLSLPVHRERTVTCSELTDGSTTPRTCTITFTP